MINELIHEKIAWYAKKFPLNIAATDESGSISYSEFNSRANGIAEKLK